MHAWKRKKRREASGVNKTPYIKKSCWILSEWDFWEILLDRHPVRIFYVWILTAAEGFVYSEKFGYVLLVMINIKQKTKPATWRRWYNGTSHLNSMVSSHTLVSTRYDTKARHFFFCFIFPRPLNGKSSHVLTTAAFFFLIFLSTFASHRTETQTAGCLETHRFPTQNTFEHNNKVFFFWDFFPRPRRTEPKHKLIAHHYFVDNKLA